MKTLHIQIFSDTICPWCRIGKKNLIMALQELDISTGDVDFTYNTFFLNKDIPVEGIDYKIYLSEKLDGMPSTIITSRQTRIGKESGVIFNFDKIKRLPNTIVSNTLIYLTPQNKKDQMIDKVTEAYFENGRDIGAVKVLLELTTEVGASITLEQLLDKNNQDQVLQQDTYAKSIGITSVPYFIFNDTYSLKGSQPVSAFKNIIERILGETEILM